MCHLGLFLILALVAGCDEETTPTIVDASTPAVAAIAQLIDLSGPVSIERAGVRKAAVVDDALIPGDELVTGAGASAVIRYTDGTEVSAEENTRFEVSLEPGGLGLELGEGTVISRAREGGTPRLVVRSRTGAVEIVQGSELKFALSGEDSSMDVLFGEISVVKGDGGRVRLVAGETLDFALGQKQRPQVIATEALVLVMSPTRGTPLLKAANSQRFSPLKRGEAEVPKGTAFQVPPGAEARLRSEGVSVLLGSDSAGALGTSVKEDGAERHALSLDKGSAKLQLKAGNHSVELDTGAQTLTVSAKEAAAADVVRSRETTTLTVRTGAVSVTAFGKTEQVSSNQMATLAGGKLTVSDRLAPLVRLPFARRVKVYADVLAEVALQLPAGGGAKRRVEVATDRDFQSLLLDGQTTEDFVSVSPPRQGELFWRVAGDATGSSAVFEPDRGRSVLKSVSPTAEVTETGQKATVVFQSAPPAITLSFVPRAGASQYAVKVYRANDLKTPIIDQKVAQPLLVLKSGRLREGDYLWSAAALGPRGNELGGGRMNKLELSYDNSSVSLGISRPRPNEVTRGAVQTEGIAPEGSKLFINSNAVALDRKGRFSTTVPDAEALVYQVLLPSGTEAYWVRTLRK